LIYEFFFTGLFAVGGGYATIPFLYRMQARHPAWFSAQKLTEMIALAQCAPSAYGSNMASFVGFAVSGVPGAVASVLALMAPTIAVDLLAVRLMDRFSGSQKMENLMFCVRPASAGLIAAAALTVLTSTLMRDTGFTLAQFSFGALKDLFAWRNCLLYVLILPFLFWKRTKKTHPAVWICVGGIVGAVFGF
jgi:chromate transporter